MNCRIFRAPTIILVTAIALLTVLWPVLSAAEQKTKDIRSIAFFGFRLINTSIQPPSEAEFQRLKLLDGLIKKKLASSKRFKVEPVPADIMDDVKKGQDFGQCSCEADYGKKVGTKLVGWGTVQKVSNLILNINVYVLDAETNKYVFVRSVDIRGNNDTSWTRGLNWLLRHYLNDLK